MAQDILQQVQALVAQGRFEEARALLQRLDQPEVPRLLEMLDKLEAQATAETGEAGAGDFLARLSQRRQAAEKGELISQAGDQRVYDAGTYQMLWDCQYCGTQKLLGLTHRFCPNCGAAQNPNARYYPAEDEMVAVEDHEYVGADQICPACNALNSGQAEYCGNCGQGLSAAAKARQLEAEHRAEGGRFDSSGSRDVVKEAFSAEMQRVGVQPAPRAAAGGGPKWLPIALVIIAVLVCVGIGVTLFATSDTTVSVTGHTWARQIAIEEFSPVERSEWCDSVPGGAYNLTQRREVRRYNRVPDGERCETVRRDNGDGTFRMEQQCTTIYRDDPVYDQKCYFLVNAWVQSRSEEAEGERLEEPHWPRIQLACEGQQRLGCERVAGRNERYLLLLRASEGDGEYSCPVDYDRWRGAALNSRWNLEVGSVLGDARCDSLEPAG